jgi:hypothetical protein
MLAPYAGVAAMLRATLAAAFLLGSAPSCPDLYSVATHGFTMPALATEGATAVPDARGLNVAISFVTRNPNPFPIEVSGVDFQVALNGTLVFAGSRDGVRVAENGSGVVDLRGALPSGSPVFRQLQQLQPGATQIYLVTGIAHVASPAGIPVDVDFSTTGSFVVPSGLPASP